MSQLGHAFLSLPVDSQLIPVIAFVQRSLEQGLPTGTVRWTAPEQLHLSVKFLGDAEPTMLEQLTERLRPVCAAIPPFHLRLERSGCFPDFRRPDIIWIEANDPSGTLQSLVTAVERECADVVSSEDHPFDPHITIGRISSRHPRDVRVAGTRVSELNLPPLGEWRVGQLEVIRSERPKGYTRIAAIPLGT